MKIDDLTEAENIFYKKEPRITKSNQFYFKVRLINQEISILLKDSKRQGDGFYEWLRKIGGASYVVLSLVYILLLVANPCDARKN